MKGTDDCGNSFGRAPLERKRECSVDGRERLEIAWGEFRWEGASMQRGGAGNFGNGLEGAPLGASADWKPLETWRKFRWEAASMQQGRKETVEIDYGESEHAAWTDRKSQKYLGDSSAGTERERSVDGNSLGRALLGGSEHAAAWTDRKPWK